jgi:hypothetical protein
MPKLPTCVALGVQVKVLCTGLPPVTIGNVAPVGRPFARRVNVSPAVESVARTTKVTVWPASIVRLPMVSSTGGTFEELIASIRPSRSEIMPRESSI